LDRGIPNIKRTASIEEKSFPAASKPPGMSWRGAGRVRAPEQSVRGVVSVPLKPLQGDCRPRKHGATKRRSGTREKRSKDPRVQSQPAFIAELT